MIYVNLAGFHVKSVDATLAGRYREFSSPASMPRRQSRVLFGFLADRVGSGQAVHGAFGHRPGAVPWAASGQDAGARRRYISLKGRPEISARTYRSF